MPYLAVFFLRFASFRLGVLSITMFVLHVMVLSGGFRALIGVEDVNRFLKVPWGNSDVAEAICVFLNSLLMSDTPMDDGRQGMSANLSV